MGASRGASKRFLGLTMSVPRLLTFGATAEEAREPLPGDDEVPGAQLQGTRAVTIDASPGRCGRGSPRSAITTWAEPAGTPSTWRTTTASRAPGRSSPTRSAPGRAGDRRGGLHGPRGRGRPAPAAVIPLPKAGLGAEAGPWPPFGSCSWVFVLRPLQEGRTRLIARTRCRVDRLDLSAPFWPLFLVADLASQPTMLRGSGAARN